MIYSLLNVVLVRTEGSANIGAVARAMANMGGDRLILIDPKTAIDESSHQMAAGAQEPLAKLVVYSSWAEFYQNEGEGLRIALTRRMGKQRKSWLLDEFLELQSDLDEKIKSSAQPLYLIFGPESSGLNTDDLSLVNVACYLPTFGSFASMNLAQAVMLALYLVQRYQYEQTAKERSHPERSHSEHFHPEHFHRRPSLKPTQNLSRRALPIQPIYFPDLAIRQWLTAMGFNINARKASAYRTFRRLLLLNQPTRHELQVFEAVLQQNIRKLQALSHSSTKSGTNEFSS